MSNITVYKRQGGDALVIGNGGTLVVQTGGKIVPNSETQAATISAVSLTTVAWTTGDKAKVNSVITALKGVGILATS